MNPSRATHRLVATVCCFAMVPASPLLAEGWIVNARADASLLVEEDTPLGDLDTITTQAFLPSLGNDLKVTSMVQLFAIDPRELGEKRVKGRGEVAFDCFGQTGSRTFGSKNKKFSRLGNRASARKIPANAGCDFLGATWNFQGNRDQPAGSSVNVRTGVQRIADGADPACFDADTLCLGEDNRYKVEVDWRSFTRSGSAIPLATAIDTGTFWFFDPENIEMVVKVLDGCDFNGHFWVFAGALTDVEVTLTVTDTQTDQVRTYTNPLNTPFQPIQDTQAFATCP